MPTGEVVEMPDQPSPQQIADLASIHAPQAQAPQRSVAQNLGRSVGLAARMPLQAAGSTAGMVGDALSTAVNMGGAAIGHNPNLPMPSGLIQRGIDAVTPTPEGTGERVADFIGSTVAGGVGRGVDPLARLATRGFTGATQRALSQRDQVIQRAQAAGLVVPPSQSTGGAIGTAMEGIAGKSKLANDMRMRNQKVIDALAARAAKLPEGAQLSYAPNMMQQTYDEGYGPIKELGRITTGGQYRHALDKVLNDFQGASNSFPEAVDDNVRKLVDGYRVRGFDSNDAVSAIQSLRKNANSAYRKGDSNLAGAHQAIAKALEDNIELNVGARGEDGAAMLGNFRDARKTLAKQKAVSETMDQATGHVSAMKMAHKLQKGAPLSDGLDLIGQFGSVASPVAGMPKEMSSPNASNSVLSLLGGLVGGPAAGAGIAAMPIGRAGLRRFMMSPMGQRMIAPSLDPGILARLSQSPEMMNSLPTAYTQSGLYGPRN